jgi:hypothetical protein
VCVGAPRSRKRVGELLDDRFKKTRNSFLRLGQNEEANDEEEEEITHPKTNSMASITLDLPDPLGPTTEEKHCACWVWRVGGVSGRCKRLLCSIFCPSANLADLKVGISFGTPIKAGNASVKTGGAWCRQTHMQCQELVPFKGEGAGGEGLAWATTLWNGPMTCSPKYDLKLTISMRSMIRRVAGAPAAGSAMGTPPSMAIALAMTVVAGRCERASRVVWLGEALFSPACELPTDSSKLDFCAKEMCVDHTKHTKRLQLFCLFFSPALTRLFCFWVLENA